MVGSQAHQSSYNNICVHEPFQLITVYGGSNTGENQVRWQRNQRTSLVVQWLRLHTPSVGVPGSIPVQGTRPHVSQPRAHMPQLRSSRARNINKCLKIKDRSFLTEFEVYFIPISTSHLSQTKSYVGTNNWSSSFVHQGGPTNQQVWGLR